MNEEILWRVAGLFVLVVAFQIVVAQLGTTIPTSSESKRRVQHALTGHLLVQSSYLLPLRVCLVALVMGAAGVMYVCYFHSDTYLQVFGPLLRSDEVKPRTLPGAFYFLLGTGLAAAICSPLDKARYAVHCLAFCDPMASWIGQTIKSPRMLIFGFPQKSNASVAGCLACFVTAVLVGYWYNLSRMQLWTGAFACTVAEAVPILGLNDNLLIPLVTGAAVTYCV